MDTITARDIARTIDHAVLKPDATLDDVRSACKMARRLGILSVCVRPSDVPVAVEALSGSETIVGTVLGFPHGTTSTAAKVAEARQAFADGAREVDMVLNIGRLLSGDLAYVEHDIRAVAEEAYRHGGLLKVIFETFYLDDERKKAACAICTRSGVDFVKTSTGFAGGGATIPDLDLMRRESGPEVALKASGGVRDLDAVLAAISVGATRIGTSSTEAILREAAEREAAGTLAIPAREETLARSADAIRQTKAY
jgi:deoxyribose-phosphate aldolase